MSLQRYLLRSHILKQIGDNVAFTLELTGIEGHTASSLGPDAESVVRVVRSKATGFDFLHGKVSCKLVYNGSHHFKVRQFIWTLFMEIKANTKN